jgi:hypothetical protein
VARVEWIAGMAIFAFGVLVGATAGLLGCALLTAQREADLERHVAEERGRAHAQGYESGRRDAATEWFQARRRKA